MKPTSHSNTETEVGNDPGDVHSMDGSMCHSILRGCVGWRGTNEERSVTSGQEWRRALRQESDQTRKLIVYIDPRRTVAPVPVFALDDPYGLEGNSSPNEGGANGGNASTVDQSR